MSKKDKCLADTYKHIRRVSFFINQFVKNMIDRADRHDDSKLEEPELSGFAAAQDLGKVEYNSPEYKEMLAALKPTLDHHYANNSHHPEHWKNGVEDMNLMDLVEMLCDWRAATERNKNGNIKKSIEANAERFGMTPQLRKILENTARDLF